MQTELDDLATFTNGSEQVIAPPVGKEASNGPNTKRGLAWVIGAFAICPCHLPFTLGLLATLLGGTSFGVVLQQYPIIAGAVITLVWLGGTWRGFRYLRATQSLKTCQLTRR